MADRSTSSAISAEWNIESGQVSYRMPFIQFNIKLLHPDALILVQNDLLTIAACSGDSIRKKLTAFFWTIKRKLQRKIARCSIIAWNCSLRLREFQLLTQTNNSFGFVKQEILARLRRVFKFSIFRAGSRLRSQFLNGNYADACPPFSLQMNCYLTGGRVVPSTFGKVFNIDLFS